MYMPRFACYLFPGGSASKESTCKKMQEMSIRWLGKISWRTAQQPTPVFLPVESHGQRSLAGYSPWGHKESDMTERLTQNTWNLSGRRFVWSGRTSQHLACSSSALLFAFTQHDGCSFISICREKKDPDYLIFHS